MLDTDGTLCTDSFFSSKAQFELCAQSSSRPLVSVEDFAETSAPQFAGTGNQPKKDIFSKAIPLPANVSASWSEIVHFALGKDGSNASDSQEDAAASNLGHGSSGEFGFLGFDELTELWENTRLSSHETAVMPPPQKVGWNHDFHSCPGTSGNPVSTYSSESVEYERLSAEQSSCSSAIPTCEGMWAGEVDGLHCLDSPCLATASTSVGMNSTFLHSVAATRLPKSHHIDLPSRVGRPLKIPSSSMAPESFQQQSASRKSRFHCQSLVENRAQGEVVVEHPSRHLDDSQLRVNAQHSLVHRQPSLSLSRSPELPSLREPGESTVGRKANLSCHLKLEDEADLEFLAPPRKYEKRRAVDGIIVQPPLNHVQRERQRRDLMTSRIAELELLLPRSRKRDRVGIVFDAIHLLEKLERDVEVLQKKFEEAKMRKAGAMPLPKYKQTGGRPKAIECKTGTSGSHLSNGVVIKRFGMHMKPVVLRTHHTWCTSETSRSTQGASLVSSPPCSVKRTISDKRTVFVEFHVQLDDTVAIQEEKLLKCQCRGDYLTTVMGVVDELQLDVVNCNITKLCGYSICMIGLKTRTTTDTTTAAQVACRLQSLVDIDMSIDMAKEQATDVTDVTVPRWNQ